MNQPGKWEEITFRVPKFSSSYTSLLSDLSDFMVTETFCSKCGGIVPEAKLHEYKYCPWCGDKKEDPNNELNNFKACKDCKYDECPTNIGPCSGCHFGIYEFWTPKED